MTRPGVALANDFYEYTMAAAYFEKGRRDHASFELFVRALPRDRSYLIAAGIDEALDYLENLRFTDEEIEYLRSQPSMRGVSGGFFEYLRGLRFTGTAAAVEEGRPFFANEPILRITAPVIEAQIVETAMISIVSFATLVASKAARVVDAAQGRRVSEFGSRHAHGIAAGVAAGRAAYLAGCVATSNTEAGRRFGIPLSGTMAHSFVMAYEDEEEALRDFAEVFPESAILLLDTYDTMHAVETIIRSGIRPTGVRLDSGDLLDLSRRVRARLDEAGLEEVKIVATSDLNEYRIAELVAAGAPIDGFGVGTEISTSKDHPALSSVYKLVHIGGAEAGDRVKLSEEKFTYPGCKQVWRFRGPDGRLQRDLVSTYKEEAQREAEPLLTTCISRGVRVQRPLPLDQLRDRCLAWRAELPDELRLPVTTKSHPVEISQDLLRELASARTRLGRGLPASV
jgi:nicotinate phosphoribosyltransferase